MTSKAEIEKTAEMMWGIGDDAIIRQFGGSQMEWAGADEIERAEYLAIARWHHCELAKARREAGK